MATTTIIDDAAPARTVATLPTGGRSDENRAGWLMAAPFLAFYLLFLIGPAVYGLVMSFFNTTSVRPGLGEAVGLDNYRQIFTDSEFWASMGHTVWFTVLTVPPLVILAFVLAVLAERVARGKALVRFIFFAPFVLPVTSVTMIFGWLYAAEIGLLPNALEALGLPVPDLLGEARWGFISVAALTVWWTIGFNFVLFLAGLQDIPQQVYEAAALDGASPVRTLWAVTLPLLRPTVVLVTMLQIIASMQIFNQMYLLTAGGPGTETRPVMQYIYDTGFSDYRAGYSAAATMIYFAVVLLISVVWYLARVRTRNGADA